MKDAIGSIVGKTIKAVVVGQGNDSPHNQVFLVFEDDTHYEIYGDVMSSAGGIDKGGVEAAVRSATWPGRKVEVF